MIPVEEPIVAMLLLPLVHEPYIVAFDSVVVEPWQTAEGPVIAAGATFTVTTAVDAQLPTAYDIVAVPFAIPVTTPVEPTVATEALLLAQVPPTVASASVVV
jgi:hypothetical protein